MSLPDFDQTEMRARLKYVLKQRGETMRSASLAANQGESYLAGVITNGRDPQLSRLIAVCDHLKVPLAWVVYGVDPDDAVDAMLTTSAVHQE